MSNPPVDEVASSVDVRAADPLVLAARAVAMADGLEGLSRPLLGLLHRLAAFDSFYLTSIDPVRHEQQVLFTDDRGTVRIPEGVRIDWDRTVCRQSLESGVRATTDATAQWPEQTLSGTFGISSYAGVPVRDSDERLLGTLCGVSRATVPADVELLEVMELLARLIGDRWEQLEGRDAFRTGTAESRLRDSALVLTEAEEELSAPLIALQGTADLLLREWSGMTDARRVSSLQSMRSAAKDANTRLEELLGNAREDAIARELQLQPVDLEPVIAAVVAELRAENPGRPVRHPQGESARVRADRNGLQRALRNVVGYALEHSADGSLVDVAIRRNGSTVVVSVEAQGIELPQEGDVFAPFAGRDEVASETAGVVTVGAAAGATAAGPGLALYVARNLVQAMDGQVEASISEAGGATINLLLAAV